MGPFFGKTCSWDFSVPSCHPGTLIDLANTVLANRCSKKTLCVVLGSDSTQMIVNSPVNSNQTGRFCSGKMWSQNFAVPSCQPGTFIDRANTVLANKCSEKTLCVVLGSDSTQMIVNSPVNSNQTGRFCSGKMLSQIFAVPSCHRCALINLLNNALVNKRSVNKICAV